jgi:hypothetical protein
MSEQQAEEIIEALEPVEKPKKATRKKAPAADVGLNPATIRARAIVLGRLKP